MKTPPMNLQAEQSVLGAIFVSNSVMDRLDFLEREHFYDPLHGAIFGVMQELIGAGRLASPVTVKSFFEDAPPVDQNTTVAQYLGGIVANATTIVNAAEYAKIIVETARKRSLIVVADMLGEQAYDPHVGSQEVVSGAEQMLYGIAERDLNVASVDYGSILSGVVDDSIRAFEMGGRPSGIATGLIDLDRKIGGLQPGQLIVLAGRPSMGKTALALNIATHVARKGERILQDGEIVTDCEVAFFSLEMPKEEVVRRILATDARVPASQILTGRMEKHHLQDVQVAARKNRATRLHIDETGALSLGSIAARARRMQRKRRLDLIVIDYLQIMSTGQGSRETRTTQIGAITSGLKTLAKQLRVPIILLSQLNRDVEKRGDRRPQLSDLRESGSIEQDADIVMFVHREEYYVEREKPPISDVVKMADWEAKIAACRGKAEIILSKVRSGSVGVVEAGWDGTFTEFYNLAHHVQEAAE